MRQIRAFIILMFCALQSFGQIDSLHVYFETEPGPSANQVDVKVNVNNWESLVGVNFFVLWDSTVLNAVQVPFIETTLLVGPTVTLASQIASLDPGEAQYNFFSTQVTLPDSTHIFTLRFDIVGNPCDETLITIGDIGPFGSQMIEVTGEDSNGQLVSGIGANSNDITYMIPGNNCNSGPPVNFAFSPQIADTGDNICIPLTVMQFDSIDSFGGSVNWDSQILQYTGVQNFGVSAFSATDFNNINPGQLTYAWADLTANNPETLPDGATLFEVCFDVIGAAGTGSALAITGIPNVISVTMAGPTPSSQSVPLAFTVTNGNVVIPSLPLPDPVLFSFGNVTGATGDNVCLPLTVRDFNNITAFGGTVAWDEAVLQYTNVTGFGFNSLSASNFNQGAGILSYSWMNPVASETLPNDATLFEVCFDIIGGAGSSSSVGLVSAPSQIFVTQGGPNPGDPSMPIGFNISNGVISVPGIVLPDPVIFTFPSLSADNGDNICVPLTVQNFTSIVSANGSISWDPAVISYTGAQNFGLTGLSSSLNDGSAPSGVLSYEWADMTPATPESLADGATFMEVCFDVVGAGMSSSTITVTNSPTPIAVGFQDPDPMVPVVNIETTINAGNLSVNGGGGGLGGEGEAIVYTIPSINADQGTNVCIPITVDFFIDIVSATGSITWDPTILTYTGAQNFGVAGLNTALNIAPASTGTITFGWFDNSPASAETIGNGGTFMELCFDVIGCDNEMTSLSITGTPTDISVGYGPDPALPTEPIDAIVINGSVSTSGDCGGGGGPGGVGEGVVFTFPDVTAMTGDNVCVPLTVDFFEDIVSTTGTLMWDPSILTYTGAQNFGVAGLNTALNTAPAATGMITYGWFDNTPASAETIPNGGTFMELCFDVIGGNGDVSTLKVTNNPTDISVGYGPDPASPTVPIDAILNDGSVTAMGNPPPPGSEVIFTFPDLCFGPGQEVCFPLVVQNFERISQVDFTLTWDPSVMNYIGVDNAMLSGFNPSGSINSMNIDQGFLTFSWFDGTAVNPNTFDDGESIIDFCFQVVGGIGDETNLTLTSDPTPIVVSQANIDPTVPGMEVPTVQNDGSLNVKVPETRFTLALVCEPTDQAIACVDFVTVDGFDNLVVTEWNWTWNPNELCFREITNIHPNATALDEIDFGFFGNDRMNIAWTGTNSPTTIPDGDTYFTICYDVKAACPASIAVDIVDPTSSINFFVTNESDPDNPLETEYSSCVIDVECPPMTDLRFVGNAAVVSASSCASSGSISQQFAGGRAPFTCQLTGFGAQSCTSPVTIENLPAGSYSLTITDADGESITAGPFQVRADNPLLINPGVVNITCTSSTGSITINASGGRPPYQFSGPNGPIQTHTGLAVGTYRVEVRDAAGCAQSVFVNVEDVCIPPDDLGHTVDVMNGMCGSGGKLTPTPFGGTPPYQTFFDPAISDLCNVPVNITYTVTTRDAAGMEFSSPHFVGEIAPPTLVLDVINITRPVDCNPGAGGTAEIIISGGCEPVRCEVRQIINGQTTGVINLNCPGIVTLLPGTYEVTAVPAFGQAITRVFTIPPAVAMMPLDITRVDEIASAGPCFGDNGTVQINVVGGCGNVTLTMVNGMGAMTTPPANVQFQLGPAGTYVVTAMDANGDTDVLQFTLSGPTEPLVLTPMSDTCVAGVLPQGGVGPYTYVWVDGTGLDTLSTDPVFQTMNTLPDDIDDLYSVTVTDAANCTAVLTQAFFCPGIDTTILDPCASGIPGELQFSALTGGSASCAGVADCDGRVSGFITQECHTFGASPYTVTAINSVGEQVEIILNEPGAWSIGGLCAEEYTIKVTDSQGNCFFPGVNLPVIAPPILTATLDNIDCSLECENTGSFNLSVTGGPINGSYRVNWTDINGEALGCIFECDSLGEGTYFLEVEDDNGCILTDFVDIELCEDQEACIEGPVSDECIGDPVMTPNGDGLNDIFALDCAPNNNNNELNIFDRWGRLVHTSTNYQNDWGGLNLDGEELLEGAYHWVFIQDNGTGGRTITKGTVTLLNTRP